MSHVGYISFITEVELGWGDRPDGFVISLNKIAGESFVRKSDAFNRVKYPKEFSVAGDFKVCAITDKAKEEIENSKSESIWIRPKDFKEYVIDV